ncbi:MAG: O-antigen ligase family protein [Sphingobacteriales bacterium]|nr:O-antigen ligase family protein [Sphingobacteriales bacterium]MCC7222170.1 O-antigen ligase family protein [Chitinophagales bacterium]
MSNPFEHIARDNGGQSAAWKRHFSLGAMLGQRMASPLGLVVMAAMGLLLALAIGASGYKMGILLVLGIVGLPVILSCLFNQQIGITVSTTVSFFVLGVKRFMGDVPIGLLLDVLLLLMFLGLAIQQFRSKNWSFANNPVSYLIAFWLFYNFVEFINPDAASRMAWFYTVRGMAGVLLLYYIGLYAFSSLPFIKFTLKLFIGLSFIAALYGLKQEFIGLTNAELAWLHSDPKTFELIFQGGRIRIFSFLSDPTAYGILMTYMAMLCLCLMPLNIATWKRVILGIAAACMLACMAYAGTRTAYVLLPIAMFFYMFLTLNKRVLIGGALFFVLGSGLMMKSTGNAVIYRIQTAFSFKEDASMKLRLMNQAYIKPFIQSHPLGGGLGSTGIWGARFSPNNPLSKFPPDSGYVRTAVEQGWIGLLLYCTLLFVTLAIGIYQYKRLHDPDLKTLQAAVLTLVFCLVFANYPQEAIILLPNSFIFYLSMAMLAKIPTFDPPSPSLLTQQS